MACRGNTCSSSIAAGDRDPRGHGTIGAIASPSPAPRLAERLRDPATLVALGLVNEVQLAERFIHEAEVKIAIGSTERAVGLGGVKARLLG